MEHLSSNVVLERDYWALTKLWHVVDALYIWEFVTAFDYEWSVIRGDRPYRWTIWIYSLTRVATLLAAILNLVGLDAANPINCQAWVTFNFIFAYVALASSSLLVVFRIIAIWGKKMIVVALGFSVWGANVLCLSQGIIRVRAGWKPEESDCVVLNITSNKPTLIVILVTDVLLFLIMLFGLFSLRRRGGNASELGRLLWKQGITWLLIGTIAELMPVLFISLYLSDAVNAIFLMPALFTMSISSTRMYRSLSDCISSVDIADPSDSPPKSDRSAPSTKISTIVPCAPSSQTEMNSNLPYYANHNFISFPNRFVSFLDLGGQDRGQVRVQSFDGDLESTGEINLIAKPLGST